MDERDDILAGQLAYYRARAAEYDEWWERRGRYDRGPEVAAAWRAEEAIVDAALAAFDPRGRVLELAPGTGIWTRKLARTAASLTVVDAAPEMLALNRERVAGPCARRGVAYAQERADLFAWEPGGAGFDVVFFSFWLSHVPPERFAPFWRAVAAALAPGGRVFLVDSLRDRRTQAEDHRLPDADGMIATRRLNDGSEHRIVKRFYEPAALTGDLARLGFAARLETSGAFFLFGEASATRPPNDGRSAWRGGSDGTG